VRLFRQRAVARVHALERRIFELVDEIIRNRPEFEDEIDGRLDRSADLDPNIFLKADRFPERSLYLAGSGRLAAGCVANTPLHDDPTADLWQQAETASDWYWRRV
jgi:hypothetical protein